MELIEQVKLLTNNTNEQLISLVLEKAKAEICSYLNMDFSQAFDNITVDIAILKLNRLGAEGLSSQSYSGVSENYIEEYPPYIINQLNRYKKKWGIL